jgi:hypothetical protein
VGPYSGGLNLCGVVYSNGSLSTTITFDITSGVLIFDTDDYETFPPGSYEFVITITIGTVSVNTNVVIILNPNCGSNELTVITQPAQTYYYHLSQESMCLFVYDINAMVSWTSTTSCGVPVVEFIDIDGSALPAIFYEDRSVQGAFSICVSYSMDLTWVG